MRGFQSVKIVFGGVLIETKRIPGNQPELECEISLGPKEKLWLRGHQVEDFMQCIEALYRLKRGGRDP